MMINFKIIDYVLHKRQLKNDVDNIIDDTKHIIIGVEEI